MGGQGRLSIRIRLVGCKESKRYSQTLERASCRYSTEWHGSKRARARTKVPEALPECEDSQNRNLSEIARSNTQQSGARESLAHSNSGSPWVHVPKAAA